MEPSGRPAPTRCRSAERRAGAARDRRCAGRRRAALSVGALLGLLAAAPLAAQAPRLTARARIVPPAAAPETAAVAFHAPGAEGAIAVGETVRGELAAGDRLMSDSTYADVWQLQGTAGERVEIELRSDDFDTYLEVLDSTGTIIGQDDDSGGNLNSRLSLALPAAGTYRIVVNSAGHEPRVGAYTLTVR